jgi:hypothetical protein
MCKTGRNSPSSRAEKKKSTMEYRHFAEMTGGIQEFGTTGSQEHLPKDLHSKSK